MGREGSKRGSKHSDIEGFEKEIMMIVKQYISFFDRRANVRLSQIDSIDKAFLKMVETWAALIEFGADKEQKGSYR